MLKMNKEMNGNYSMLAIIIIDNIVTIIMTYECKI